LVVALIAYDKSVYGSWATYEYVEVKLVDKTLRIPWAYKGGWAELSFKMALPDLEPKSAHNSHLFKAGSRKALTLLLLRTPDPEYSLKMKLGAYTDGVPYYKEPIEYGHGLTKYEGIEHASSDAGRTVKRSDFYIHRNDDGEIKFIMDVSSPNVPNPLCKISGILLGNIPFHTGFSTKHINQSVEIVQKIKELLESFVIESEV